MKKLNELSRILTAVTSSFGVNPDETISPSRKKEHSLARHAVCRIARDQTNFTLKEIGEFLGGRDHATMLTSYRKSQDLLDSDKLFREKMNEAIETLSQEMLVSDLGSLVYHSDFNEGKTPLKLVGLRMDSVELETNSNTSWFPISGLINPVSNELSKK